VGCVSRSYCELARLTPKPLSLPDSTLAVLQAQLEDLTAVPPALQKLLYNGKKLALEGSTIAEAGLKDGTKVQMLGPTRQELERMKVVEDKERKKDRILHERSLKAPTKVRSTGSSSSASLKYTFHRLEPLQHLPNPSSAVSLLKRLSEDPAIAHVMQKHQLEVGLLTELAPHEHPGLLGLNVNAGQIIKLRLRTDVYDGFRLYADVRRVLCHELAHNMWHDHGVDFKEFNSKLNREVAEFDRGVRDGTHHLWQGDAVFESSASLEAEAHAHILGGGGVGVDVLDGESREERRRRLLEATMNRLRKEEEELEESCGTGARSSSD